MQLGTNNNKNVRNEAWISGAIYKKFIKELHAYITQTETNEYSCWKKDFIIIHGNLDTQRKLDIKKIEDFYNVILDEEEKVFKLIFCLETYYSILLRLIAHKVVFKNSLYKKEIFNKDYFTTKGIVNYECKDDFNWFLSIPHELNTVSELYNAINLNDYLHLPDFIKDIFEFIIPNKVRHSIGEFYTPDWLSSFVIDTITVGDDNAPFKKYLDPSCGSGTFLINLIRKYRISSNKQIYSNIVGIDINPLSVLACKTNYLLQYSLDHSFSFNNKLHIPIYYADAILANSRDGSLFENISSDYDTISFGQVDYIVGNPPWVNWEYLPKSYKTLTTNLWQYYNLFSQKGMDASFIKEDISVLFTYSVIDKYLKINGKLGFIIKETLFKSIKQGEGFRKFHIEPTNTPIKPYRVDDLTAIKPFKDATTRASLIFIVKGDVVQYPVDYIVWKPHNGNHSYGKEIEFTEINEKINFEWKKAIPSVSEKVNSGWITVTEDNLSISKLVLGKSDYIGRTGVFTGGANAVFWLQILNENGNYVNVKNINDRAKNKAKTINVEIEKDLLFPFITGNELELWEYKYSKYILCPHNSESKMYPIKLQALKNYQKTLSYFEIFRDILEKRKGFTSFDKHIHLEYYYTLQRIGEYTFSPYKVAWRFISNNFRPAVIEYANDKYLGTKNIIPNEKIIYVGLNNKEEAYYLCGLLSSKIYRNTIEGYIVPTQVSSGILKKLKLNKFDINNNYHNKISELCFNGHKSKDKNKYLNQIDIIVQEMINH